MHMRIRNIVCGQEVLALEQAGSRGGVIVATT